MENMHYELERYLIHLARKSGGSTASSLISEDYILSCDKHSPWARCSHSHVLTPAAMPLLLQPKEKCWVTSCLKTFEPGLWKFLSDRLAKVRSGRLTGHLHLGVGLKFSGKEKPLQFHLDEKSFDQRISLPTWAGRVDWENTLSKTKPWAMTERSHVEATNGKRFREEVYGGTFQHRLTVTEYLCTVKKYALCN